jgi:hypothetical protein
MTIPASQRAACRAHQARADERATKVAPVVKELQATGITSLNGPAAALNARRIRTPAGRRLAPNASATGLEAVGGLTHVTPLMPPRR